MKQRTARQAAVSLALLLLASLLFASASIHLTAASPAPRVYYPGPGDKWERKSPDQLGMDPALLEQAISFAKTQTEPESIAEVISARQRQESDPEIIGPTREHGTINGLVIRHGYIVAEFGDTNRADMTFSAAKSFLSALAGLAFDRGMIKSVDDPVRNYIHDGGYDSPHNAAITWRHMLQQTNEWEGRLWDKPSTIDEPKNHKLQEPGAFWNYNDVRVNRLALSLLRIWKQPLPELLKKEFMNPIDASDTWEWHGYRNSDVVIDGKKINSVSGGGHWGGGLFIGSRDMARFGYLFLCGGKWKDKQLISQKWIEMMTTPSDIKTDYGFLWWLKKWPGDSRITFAARGAGGNVIWVDPNNDLVVVLRWAANHDEIFKRIRAAVK
ncbi:MAG: serine hydrolase [Blastocatellia bacterium AA13]|nr:MAG: serine hydrolase [Blastocatellia bacterium AA13]